MVCILSVNASKIYILVSLDDVYGVCCNVQNEGSAYVIRVHVAVRLGQIELKVESEYSSVHTVRIEFPPFDFDHVIWLFFSNRIECCPSSLISNKTSQAEILRNISD